MTSLFGIRNMGNTCYLNSVIHCLRYNSDLETYLLSNKFEKEFKDKSDKRLKGLDHEYKRNLEMLKKLEDGPEKDFKIRMINHQLAQFKKNMKYPLIESFANILKKTKRITPKTIIRPESFINKLDRDFMEVALNQNDAHEALIFLLDNFHTTISKNVKIKKISGISDDSSDNWKKFYEKDFSEIIRIFFGQYEINVKCNKCKNVSTNFEPYNHISVELTSNLTKSLDISLSEEDVEKRCEKCSTEENVEMTKQFSISMFPAHLIIQIKRFNYVDGRSVKIKGKIEVPELIDLSKYYAYKNRYGMYKLYAGIIHRGTPTNGHYISYCKGPDDFWVEYDDETVRTPINAPRLKSLKEESYVLFYKKL